MKRRTWRQAVIVNRRTRAMVGVIRNLRNSSGGRKRGLAKALALPVLLLIAFGGVPNLGFRRYATVRTRDHTESR